MKKSTFTLFIVAMLSLGGMSCKSKPSVSTGSETSAVNERLKDAPSFNADSAYRFIENQLAFGPRVPGTPEHDRCGDYIIAKMKSSGADTVMTQKTVVTAYNGDKLPITNIMARFGADKNERILLLAHWDTRPWADNDSHTENHSLPIPGANDGGSGVATLMEIGRHINEMKLPVGVDLLFVDAEDYGRSDGFDNNSDTWCLGTQHWIKNHPYTATNLPKFGICLDMVGGNGAVFHREFVSEMKAKEVVDHVWNVASMSGYDDRFINSMGGSLVDDHVFVNEAGIPTIDIVELNSTSTRSFPASWHTMSDDIDNIDRESLKAAGQTVLNVLYLEGQD